MSSIRSSGNTATEAWLIGFFRRHRLRGWRRKVRLTGSPDFVFPRLRLAVFVDGCFWHGCKRHGSIPATNRTFWTRKLALNSRRDKKVNRELRVAGWTVVRIWQHELAPRNVRCLLAKFRRLGVIPVADRRAAAAKKVGGAR